MRHKGLRDRMTLRRIIIVNERRAWWTMVAGAALAGIALGLAWSAIQPMPMPSQVRDAAHEQAKGMTYDEAIDECGWISAADNVSCLVIPDDTGAGWQAYIPTDTELERLDAGAENWRD